MRSWLCGIARNIINSSLRKHGREPSHRAESLEEIHDGPSPEPLPIEHTISKEEAEILWRSLERIPESYREPLILFYREHQSIETVAANLELTEDAVKQRLSRGRKLLQDQVLAFVEGALARTVPGSHFTLSVLSALPATTLSTKLVLFGAAAKGGATAKGLGFLGVLGAILSPLLAIVGNYASYRMSMNEARTDEERYHVKRLFMRSLSTAAVLTVIFGAATTFAIQGAINSWEFWILLLSEFLVLYFFTLAAFIFATLGPRKRYLRRILNEQYAGRFPKAAYEYQSRASAFGWPLVHIRIGDRFDVLRGPVKAWIAIGSSHAVGLFFASGGLAIAPLSFGGIAIGLVPFGALALGLVSLGAASVGVWAYGGAAIGWQVCCGCGLAWHSAVGGIAAARDFALGGFVRAAQANTDIAKRFFQQDFFPTVALWMANHGLLLTLLWIIPMSLQARVIARARRQREALNS